MRVSACGLFSFEAWGLALRVLRFGACPIRIEAFGVAQIRLQGFLFLCLFGAASVAVALADVLVGCSATTTSVAAGSDRGNGEFRVEGLGCRV